jgi:hypothetical protein
MSSVGPIRRFFFLGLIGLVLGWLALKHSSNMGPLPLVSSPTEDASPSSASTAASPSANSPDPAQLSPMKTCRIVNESLMPPRLLPAIDKLPKIEDLTLQTLLQWHAQTQLDSDLHPPVPKRRRLFRKTEPSIREMLETMARNPLVPLIGGKGNWQQRRDAAYFARGMFAQHYGAGVRETQSVCASLWRNAAMVLQNNIWILQQRLGNPVPKAEKTVNASDSPRQVHGLLLTWQTSHGRSKDKIQDMQDNGLSINDMVDLCVHDSVLQSEFDTFTNWIDAMCKNVGFDVWSASMELNPRQTGRNKIHLHAYLCLHWKKWNQKGEPYNPIEVRPREWTWVNFCPHIAVARVRSNGSPQRHFVPGLYYQSAPKIGSIFRRSNIEVFKDTACPAVRNSDM